MPAELFAPNPNPQSLDLWASAIAMQLRSGHPVLAAIARAELQANLAPALLAERLAQVVARAVGRAPVRQICAEGGATAAAVARAFGWTRFAVGRQFAGGVVELQPSAAGTPAFVIKVGSYDWPEAIWPKTGASAGLSKEH